MKKYIMLFEEYSMNAFKELMASAPDDLKVTMGKLKYVKQDPKWHPEGDVLTHTEIVTNRLHGKYHDQNLTLAGLFHDIGKLDTYDIDPKDGTPTAHGHEKESLNYIEAYADWIKQMGADPEIVLYVVKNHMRVKFINDMRNAKRNRFRAEPWFHYVEKFSTCDRGGTDI